ncbi:MAG: enolase C-terminal domain-like protein [Acidobacteriota bacterium]|nr:enolase C-terminal domain-like protein [Acidobacteriota bacterium]
MDRRAFLKTGLAALASAETALTASAADEAWAAIPPRRPTGPLVGRPRTTARISKIDLFPVLYPVAGYFKFFAGPGGRTGRPAVIIKMTADDGTIGWGQSVPLSTWSDETWEGAVSALLAYFGPALIGLDPEDPAGAQAALDKAVAGGFSTGLPITRAGLDLALHDLIGKRRGISLARLWGLPEGGRLTLSWTVNVKALADAEAVIEDGKTRGYAHFNIKIGPDPDFDIALARTVRKASPQGFLWADANGGYDPETALKAAPRLADAGVAVLESPLKPNRIAGYQALKKQGALPILMDEGVVSPADLEEFIRLGMLDGIAAKPARCGGLRSNKRQIEICRERGLLWLGSGLTDPDISLAASLALYGAFGLDKPAALNGPQFLAAEVLKTPLRIENGIAHVPIGPGLGIEVDEEKVVDLMKRSGGDKLLK